MITGLSLFRAHLLRSCINISTRPYRFYLLEMFRSRSSFLLAVLLENNSSAAFPDPAPNSLRWCDDNWRYQLPVYVSLVRASRRWPLPFSFATRVTPGSRDRRKFR